MGKVYLVGAGCGDLDLYTKKALRCIENADCLVYDSLVDVSILELCPSRCEKIFVGKRAHHHAMAQADICQLLVDKAKLYDFVVRLKGGDVYVFGRGGEEGQLLAENEIDFEVVPGVSSATAGLAYAGIPITHRGLSGGFQVYTAQLRQHQQRQFDFKKMLDDYCTYVFLMGMSQLGMIVTGFLEAGKKPQTPIAIISQASLPTQQTLVGTLEDIQAKFKATPLPTPGIIVVGEVVKMRRYLNFYETKPLFGKHILVTTVGKDHLLKEALLALGAHVDEVMTGEITYNKLDLPQSMEGYLIFTSRHGVVGFMDNFLKQAHDVRALARVAIVAIGEKTNQALRLYGLKADLLPKRADSDELKSMLKDLPHLPTYLVRGNLGKVLNCDQEFIVYQNSLVDIPSQEVHYDYGCFSCASSVYRFAQHNPSTIGTFISIGAHTTQAIQDCYGVNVKIIQAEVATKEAMVQALLGGK